MQRQISRLTRCFRHSTHFCDQVPESCGKLSTTPDVIKHRVYLAVASDPVAQLVEQRTFNPKGAGGIQSETAKNGVDRAACYAGARHPSWRTVAHLDLPSPPRGVGLTARVTVATRVHLTSWDSATTGVFTPTGSRSVVRLHGCDLRRAGVPRGPGGGATHCGVNAAPPRFRPGSSVGRAAEGGLRFGGAAYRDTPLNSVKSVWRVRNRLLPQGAGRSVVQIHTGSLIPRPARPTHGGPDARGVR